MGSDGTVTAPDGSGRQVKLITAEDVVAYLKAHPDFFEKHPELAEAMALVPRVQGPGVIDMQQAILKRLRSEIDRLKNERTEIIANSKQNQIVQNRIQAAVISIIQASTFEKMIHVVTHELPELLDVDFITLGHRGQRRCAQARAGTRRLRAGAGRHRCRHRPRQACPPARRHRRRGGFLRRHRPLREVRRADAAARLAQARPTA